MTIIGCHGMELAVVSVWRILVSALLRCSILRLSGSLSEAKSHESMGDAGPNEKPESKTLVSG